MKHSVAAFLAAGLASSALALAQGNLTPGHSSPFALNVEQRSFTVTGTVVSARGGSPVVRIDDHGHRITFSLGPGVSLAELRGGSRVRIDYRPTGSTGQIADSVKVIAGSRDAGGR
jgi:hypothetical protein